MIKDDLIRMADLAGFDVDEDDVYDPAQRRYGLDPRLEHFARLVTAFEREACAKLCEGWTQADGDACADAIRARGEK